jgi:4-hydroxy-3-methylbut-2-enyl diphosphate reductase
VPDGAPVVFSAHGVPKAVPVEASRRTMIGIDATCPLVTKVHKEAERHHAEGRQIILIGHAGHPEVVGTMGQLPPGAVLLVETVEDVQKLQVADANNLAYCTQTTLSVDDTAKVIEALQARFPTIAGPKRQDICYATTNRQAAVKVLAPQVNAMIVVGAPNSSNSMRLVDVALQAGCAKARLFQRAAELDWDWLDGVQSLGITAGASAPEVLVDEMIEALRTRYTVSVEEVRIAEENIAFNIPPMLRDDAA